MRGSTTISERRACWLVGLSRTVLSYATKPDPEAAELRDRLANLAATRRRFGYRRLHALLRREGVSVNHKRLLGVAEEAAQKRIGDTAASLGVQVSRVGVRTRNDLAGAFATMARERTDAVIVNLDALLAINYVEIAELALQYRLPTFGGARQFVEAGGLFAMV
jgi:hypothetical protein